MMKYKLIILIVLLPILLIALNEDAGTTGFSFFKVNYSARAAAMANAYTGLSNEATAVFFNPAGLVQLKSNQAAMTYMSYLDGVNCGSAVYAYSLDNEVTLAVFSKGLSAKEERTLANEIGQYAGTDGTFGISDFVFGVSAAKYLMHNLDVGINLKFLQESLDKNNATALALDFGIMHQTTNRNLKLGIAIRNIGKQLSYYTDNEYKENLPTTATAGFSYHPNNKLYITLDIYKPLNMDYSGRLGFEYLVHPVLALRAGYKSNASDWAAGGDNDLLSGISTGLGFDLQKYKLKLDYAVVSFGDLGFVNQFTINYLF